VLFFVFGIALLLDAIAQLAGRDAWEVVSESLDHHTAAWIAVGLGVVAIVLVALGRRWARAGARRTFQSTALWSPAWWSRVTFAVAVVLGIGAPVLVAFDVIEPFAAFSRPGWVVVGAGLVLLGLAVVLAALLQIGSARRKGGATLSLASRGLYARVRNPAFTGMVLLTAGGLIMAPTALGVLATVLVVVSVQIQARAVREPGLTAALGEEYAAYLDRTGRFLPRVRTPHPERSRTRTP
jgi:Ca2+/H+ antiporter, TMEM165/GDT1 family